MSDARMREALEHIRAAISGAKDQLGNSKVGYRRTMKLLEDIDKLAALTSPSPPAIIDVVAAFRRDDEGHVWLCKRDASGQHGGLAGMWEYPGGKVEPGEQLRDALRRELTEEFGATGVEVGSVLDSITTHGYRVTFFDVTIDGSWELRCHTEARWMTPQEACEVEHLPSGTIFNAKHLASPPEVIGAGEGLFRDFQIFGLCVRGAVLGTPDPHDSTAFPFHVTKQNAEMLDAVLVALTPPEEAHKAGGERCPECDDGPLSTDADLPYCQNCGYIAPAAPGERGEPRPTYRCQGCGYFTHNSKPWVEVHPCPECGKMHYWTGSFVWPLVAPASPEELEPVSPQHKVGPEEPRCPRANSDMTPCWLKDGAVTEVEIHDEPCCVGCEVSVAKLRDTSGATEEENDG